MLYISFNSVVKTLEFCLYVIKIKKMTCVNNQIIYLITLNIESCIFHVCRMSKITEKFLQETKLEKKVNLSFVVALEL